MSNVPGTQRCRSLLVCTTLVCLSSQISTLTRLFNDLTTHPLSRQGSNLPGTDSHTGSPCLNDDELVCWSYEDFWLAAACAVLA